ncbi:MAG: hypothetical protein NVSMB2_09980 [Chloroflexota bacterium]
MRYVCASLLLAQGLDLKVIQEILGHITITISRPIRTRQRAGQYRLVFYSSNGSEPPHVHVTSATEEAKFWLEPLSVPGSTAVSAHELRQIESIVSDNREQLLRGWHEYFDG